MPDTPEPESLAEIVRRHELASRHVRIDLIQTYSDTQQRIDAARTLIQQLAMHRVFDRFTRQEEIELLDRLWPLAHPDADQPLPAIFGAGAVDRIPREEHDSSPVHAKT